MSDDNELYIDQQGKVVEKRRSTGGGACTKCMYSEGFNCRQQLRPLEEGKIVGCGLTCYFVEVEDA